MDENLSIDVGAPSDDPAAGNAGNAGNAGDAGDAGDAAHVGNAGQVRNARAPRRRPSFDAIVRQMKRTYDLRVRRWRRQMSGCAWQVRYADGRVRNWIESPYPKTPISLAVFMHEVGHHAIGFDRYEAGCEEEYHVWVWALDRMRELGVAPDARVERRFERSMAYAVSKAARRGATHRDLPEALHRFLPQPPTT